MMYILLILILITLVNAQLKCDIVTEFWYNGACLQKTCLTQIVSKIRLIPLDEWSSNAGNISLGITYQMQPVQTQSDIIYQVTILYGDDESDQIVSDPVNCVDWRIYQTENSLDIDVTRKNVSMDGEQAYWPVSAYQFNKQSNAGQLQFNVTQTQLDSQQCIKFSNNFTTKWNCYFELAFIIRSTTQVSYYFDFSVEINDSFVTGMYYVPDVQYSKIRQIDRCAIDITDSDCQVNTKIKTSLWFCQDQSCNNIQDHPYFSLYVDRQFYLKHRIDDASSATQQYIENVTIVLQSFTLTMSLSQAEFNITSHQLGYNIYSVYVPIVANDVLMTATGVLKKDGQIDQNQNFVSARIRTGPIILEFLYMAQNQTTLNNYPNSQLGQSVIQNNPQALPDQQEFQQNNQSLLSNSSIKLVVSTQKNNTLVNSHLVNDLNTTDQIKSVILNLETNQSTSSSISLTSDPPSITLITHQENAQNQTHTVSTSTLGNTSTTMLTQLNQSNTLILPPENDLIQQPYNFSYLPQEQNKSTLLSSPSKNDLLDASNLPINVAMQNGNVTNLTKNEETNNLTNPQFNSAFDQNVSYQLFNTNSMMNPIIDDAQNLPLEIEINNITKIKSIKGFDDSANTQPNTKNKTNGTNVSLIFPKDQKVIILATQDNKNDNINISSIQEPGWNELTIPSISGINDNATNLAKNIETDNLLNSSLYLGINYNFSDQTVNNQTSNQSMNPLISSMATNMFHNVDKTNQTNQSVGNHDDNNFTTDPQKSNHATSIKLVDLNQEIPLSLGQDIDPINIQDLSNVQNSDQSIDKIINSTTLSINQSTSILPQNLETDNLKNNSLNPDQNQIVPYQSSNGESIIQTSISSIPTERENSLNLPIKLESLNQFPNNQSTADSTNHTNLSSNLRLNYNTTSLSQKNDTSSQTNDSFVLGSDWNVSKDDFKWDTNILINSATVLGINLSKNNLTNDTSNQGFSQNINENTTSLTLINHASQSSINYTSNNQISDQCDLESQFLYQDSCLSKSCLTKLQRIKMNPLDVFTTDKDKLQDSLAYKVDQIQINQSYVYNITIMYGDQQNAQLVNDSIDCISYSIYSTVNDFQINHARQYVNTGQSTAQWPSTTYLFNQDSQAGQINFSVSQDDLDKRSCVKLQGNDITQWECYFELALLVKEVTQVSYYFSFRVVVDTKISSSSLPSVDFSKLIDLERCNQAQNNGTCEVEVTIKSSLLFCQDKSCKIYSTTPYFQLYLNSVFWMIHMIDDVSFQKDWEIVNVTINYQSFGFQFVLTISEYELITQVDGYNIYGFTVPVVAEQVLVSASGTLQQIFGGRILATAQGVYPVQKQIVSSYSYLGQIKFSPSDVEQPVNPEVSYYINDWSNAYILAFGIQTFIALIC